MSAPRLWAIVGATGTGKSELALDLAEALRTRGKPAEVVNADAMQLYRGMDIGTAKLPLAERRGIPHHLLGVRGVGEEAAAAWYQPVAREVIDSIHRKGSEAILVGGSGLYVSSVLYEFHFPPRDREIREQLERELENDGIAGLLERLRAGDPQAAARVDSRNSRRVIRALEILEQGSSTHGASLPERPVLWYPHTRVIGLHVERSELVARLDARVELMWKRGLVAEAAGLREQGLEHGVTAARAIGYAQALRQLGGTFTEAEAITQTQALTRRYARRQVSWFKRYPDLEWWDAPVDAEALLGSESL